MSVWYALYTNPRCELRAKADLQAAGYHAYVPMSSRWVRKPKGTGKIERRGPAFVRYVFVTDGASQIDFGRIHRINGVQEIVSINGRPIPISGKSVEDVMAAEDMGLFNIGKRQDGPAGGLTLKLGDRVLVPAGPFAGRSGVVERNHVSRRSVTLAVENFSIPVEISIDGLALME